MEKNDGGPISSFEYIRDGQKLIHPGMSLRDHFAGLAMQTLLNTDPRYTTSEQIAAEAYMMADAMLEERKKFL